ncbi:IclR family transcriptional regulator [Aurantimonas endophytica]|uniref:DNA-binding IclR family transcriptional regulator n=1 Tax=Aurantimonas endophytica TaxID=1522175 RepID=A0A7W6HI56_9HYPH|nr:IclR family transcriptional regulator [Aurantimonas endophytica]MBB4005383.1 DNA-binding IclR family transcriptional regulator [Aurantimonas endophytica]MCO6405956.1 helix-turn-helix domain-containing protein [Aurantimonas endophytica]
MDKRVEETVNRRARGLDRAFDILDALREAGRPLRPNEIANAMGAPRSTIYEIVAALVKLDVLEAADAEGRVFLGRRLFLYGQAYGHHSDLPSRVGAVLDRLAMETQETAQFCVLDGNKYTVAMMREGSRPFRISSSVGERTPIPWTASGRLLLGHMSEREIRELVPEADFQLPSGDWLDPADFAEQSHRALADGHFTFDSIVDSYTHCFAVPVLRPDRTAAATLCLVAPKADALRNHADYLEKLRYAAVSLEPSFI